MNVFLCSLGVMGRRHLKGSLQAGAKVIAFDPQAASIEKAKEDVTKSGLNNDMVTYVTQFPEGAAFDVAIFAETADFRPSNISKFLKQNQAKRILLEKPVARSEAEFSQVLAEAKKFEENGGVVSVNFPRRTWPFYQMIKERLAGAQLIDMTLNGGAVGLGCNGIHYLDTFAFLTSHIAGKMESAYSKVSSHLVGSGRGPQFKDYAGHFLITKGSASFTINLNAESTATPILTLMTDKSTTWIDENNYTYRRWEKKAGFEKPNYLYGQDYSIDGEGSVEYRDLVALTKAWLGGEISLPRLSETVDSHEILFSLLKSGGASEPYLFT